VRVHPLGQVSIKPGWQHVAKKIGNTASILPISKSGVISLPQMWMCGAFEGRTMFIRREKRGWYQDTEKNFRFFNSFNLINF